MRVCLLVCFCVSHVCGVCGTCIVRQIQSVDSVIFLLLRLKENSKVVKSLGSRVTFSQYPKP